MTKDEVADKFRREVCEKGEEIDPTEDLDWFALSIGFFAACGLVGDEAHSLASEVRYKHQYWS